MKGFVAAIAVSLAWSSQLHAEACASKLSPVQSVIEVAKSVTSPGWKPSQLHELRDMLSLSEKISLIELISLHVKNGRLGDSVEALGLSLRDIIRNVRDFRPIIKSYLTTERLREHNFSKIEDFGERLDLARAFLAIQPDYFSTVQPGLLKSYFPDEEVRLKLAIEMLHSAHDQLKSAPTAMYVFPRVLNDYSLHEPVFSLELARTYLELGWLYTAKDDHLTFYSGNMDEPEARAILLQTAAKWPKEKRQKFVIDLVESARPLKLVYMDNVPKIFAIDDLETLKQLRVGILKMYLKRWDSKLKFQDLRDRFKASGLSKDPWDLVRWSLKYENLAKHVPYNEFIASLREYGHNNPLEIRRILDEKDVRRDLLAQYGMRIVKEATKRSDFEDLPLRPNAENPHEPTILAMLEDFQILFPGVVPKQLVPAVLQGTGDREIFIYLMNAAFKNLEQIERAENLDFHQVLSFAFPWPVEAMRKWSKQDRHEILAMATEIYELTDKNLFEMLRLDDKDFPGGSDLVDLLETLRNNYQMQAASEEDLKPTKKNPEPRAEILKKLITEMTQSEGGDRARVGSDNVKSLIVQGRERFLDRIRSALDVDDPNLKFSYDDLMKLTKEWSDIEPVLTLFSRLKDPRTRKVVVEIFKRSSEGRFGDFKFYSPEALPQVGFLNQEQMRSWTRSRVRVHSLTKEARGDVLRKASDEVRALVSDRLMVELTASQIWRTINRGVEVERLSELYASVATGNPVELVGRFIQGGVSAADLAAAAFRTLTQSQASLDEKRSAARVMIALLNGELKTLLGDSRETLISILRSIEKAIPKGISPELEAKGFIVSVVDHSPRLLLTVGDLVNTNSCQNYKTGTVVRTLPGYVIDANVQVMASFHVQAQHFANYQEYRAVLEALEAETLSSVRFNGNKRILQFSFRDGREIESGYLGFAFLRQMLKLGYVIENGIKHPSLRLEKPYTQNNEYMSEMENGHRILLDRLVRELNAVQDKRMTIAATRNPEGVYSDLGVRAAGGTGVQTKDYEFDP